MIGGTLMIKNCPRCKKVFNFINSPICETCVKEERDIYDSVRDYLKDHPGINLMQLSKETEVSAKKITGYIKDGRLELDSPEIECENCGTKLRTGRLCEECINMRQKNTMEKLLALNAQKPKGQKMFTDRKGR